MIRVTDAISLHKNELRETFVRASGPGGQKVNKIATAVELRFDAAASPGLPDDVRARLLALAGGRATSRGEIVIEAQRFRTREENRADARQRLLDLIRRAAHRPRRRKKTAPSRAARERRLRDKKLRGALKKLRSGGVGRE